MPQLSQNYSNSANGWDVTIFWECDYDASSAYVWWEVNSNSYGRTFQLVERNNTSSRHNSGFNISTGTELYLYVYKSGSYSQQAGPVKIKAPARPTYTVSYNPNQGTGAPASQTKTYGYTLTLSTTKPTRTGYDFLGWSTNSSATSATYSAGGSYTANSGATLYAVWKKKTYAVTFNANQGTGGPTTQTKVYGDTLTLSSTKPSREGYTFKTWNTSSAGNGANYAPGASYTANAALTLYAIWEKITYQVTFNPNTGTGGPAAQTKVYGESLTLSSQKPTKEGYTFKEWNSDRNGGGASYAAGGTYTGNAALTLYAIWTANKYTIRYNPNGGSGDMADQSMTYDVAAYLKANAFTWAGRTFKGWATTQSGPVKHQPGAYVSNLVSDSNGSITLYAVWSVNKITITFDAASNGGTCSEQNRQIDYGDTMDLPTASRQYYKFQGWFTEKTGKSIETEAATIALLAQGSPLTITSQPKNQTVAMDEVGYFIVKAYGEGLTYQWQYLGTKSGNWYNSTARGNQTDTLKVTMSTTSRGTTYRCAVTDKNGATVYTDSVVFQEGATPEILNQPQSQQAVVGETVTFNVRTSGSGMTYQWQYQNPGSQEWINADSKTDSISVQMTSALSGRSYRCIVTDKNGGIQVTNSYPFTDSITIYARFVIDSSAIVNVKGVWKNGIPYVKVNGSWKKGYAWARDKGAWKQGIG